MITRTLRAGPLSMIFLDGDIRAVRIGGHEILQRVYVAIRDRNWNTVANRISNLSVDDRGDSFTIRYAAVNREGDIDFRWSASIQGFADGAIEWSMEGSAVTSFLKNRIGFCVLHPAWECAGVPCVVETVDGQTVRGEFPRYVAPHQPFRGIRRISHEVAPRVTAQVSFWGDVFEMEDQRNWTDASFKTYSTPLALPFPARMEAGTAIQQSVRLSVTGEPDAAPAPEGRVVVEPTGKWVPVPPIGLAGAGDRALDAPALGAIRRLHLAHVRVDLSRQGHREALEIAAANARALGIPLEVALKGDADLEAIAAECARQRPVVARWLVAAGAIETARRQLSRLTPGAGFAAGSDANFADLNRHRPDPASCDALWFALNPQVHAADDLSLVENLSAQGSVVESARRFADGRPIVVSPVTLKPRFNAAATETIDCEPPSDPRQATGFCAAWTLGSLLHLAGAGAAAITYYAISGDHGVLGFPVFDLLAQVCEFSGGEIEVARSSDSRSVMALVLRKGNRKRLLMANLSESVLPVPFAGRVVEAKPVSVTTVEVS